MAKRRFDTPELFGSCVEDFIRICKEEDLSPTDYNFYHKLGVNPATLHRYALGEAAGETYAPYNEYYKLLVAFRESRLVEMMESNPKMFSVAIAQLNQVKNGGYAQNAENGNSGNVSLTIKVEGVGGEAAFK